MKKYVYEFLGYFILYFVAKHIFDINVYLSIGLGLLGSLLGKFFFKYNGVFFDKIESTTSKELTNNEAEFEIEFSIQYKRITYQFKGNFITVQDFETEKLRLFFYKHFSDKHFKEVMQFGKTKISFKDYYNPFEITVYK